MLEGEGFAAEGYIDIFDGGPTMTARTDRVRSIAEAKTVAVSEIGAPEGAAGRALVATGKLADFRCCFAQTALQGEGMVIAPAAAEALGVGTGDVVWHVPR